LSFPYTLRFLFASRLAGTGQVLGIVYRAIATHLIHKAGYTRKTVHTSAVTLIQHIANQSQRTRANRRTSSRFTPIACSISWILMRKFLYPHQFIRFMSVILNLDQLIDS